MALTKERLREILSSAGADAEHVREAVNQIMEGHLASINALRDEVSDLKENESKLKASADKLPVVQKELDDLKAKVKAEAKEREGKDYDKLKKEFDDYKADIQKKNVRSAKEAAYKDILKDAGVAERHWAKILKYSDVDGVELDDKGKITTAKDILKEIKEEWADHIEKIDKQGANTATPPANNGGNKMTKEEIMKIKDTNARQKAISENHELFGY